MTVNEPVQDTFEDTPAKDRDPDWFKRAVFYEVLVRSFQDSNGDGVGDLKGLTAKLDYLQWLGVDCLWLPPFFKSPLRDGGYDVSDYTAVLPEFGDLADFVEFVDAAHQRGMRVIIDFVMNHTSDQHPWFQESRRDPDGPYGDYYVWADDDKAYSDARIIFVDTEASNWTFDPVRKQYFFHRFFSHQPDLNYENPAVGRRSCSALSSGWTWGSTASGSTPCRICTRRKARTAKTFRRRTQLLKRVRKEIDAHVPGHGAAGGGEPVAGGRRRLLRRLQQRRRRMPHGVPLPRHAPHLHGGTAGIPLPRLGNPRQDAGHPLPLPVGHLPAQPRRADPRNGHRRRARLHVGGIRQGPPHARQHRHPAQAGAPAGQRPQPIELFTALLLSLPGSPILYYGDEIGMGDNIWLGDRDAVRTPMQWTPDRNAGFSSCDPGRLYLPTIMDPVHGYQVTNVEASMASPSSLLHWTRRMIEIRKQNPAFGLGTYTELQSSNPAVLAFLREYEDDLVLCVHNFSRFAQPTELDLRPFGGRHPVELFGGVRFPAIGELPYLLTLGGHGFYWFRLRKDAA
ncbi:maltose alpha-D-glucosyltransferase OS=Streptomyces chartreusis OX=1969 GN=treS PE=3 SV=1 [Streptomyces chartreusis]